jgi:hypothetical protein
MAFAEVLLQAVHGLTPRRVQRIIRPSAPMAAQNGSCESREVFDLDDRLHQMLRELRRALSEAISDSSEVSRTLRKIREEGYSLYLLVDCKRDPLEEDDDPLPVGSRRSRNERREREPVFQINGTDLHFLRSIGIDPTRRQRRRRPVVDRPIDHPVED